MSLFGLPLGTVAALTLVMALPLLAYGLYRIDRTRAEGHVTIFGHRPPTESD